MNVDINVTKLALGAVLQLLIERQADDFRVQANGATGGSVITIDSEHVYTIISTFPNDAVAV